MLNTLIVGASGYAGAELVTYVNRHPHMNITALTACDQVFLSDADTYVPPDQDGMGYMLAEIERGADAVGGIPSTALKGAGTAGTRTALSDWIIVYRRIGHRWYL